MTRNIYCYYCGGAFEGQQKDFRVELDRKPRRVHRDCHKNYTKAKADLEDQRHPLNM